MLNRIQKASENRPIIWNGRHCSITFTIHFRRSRIIRLCLRSEILEKDAAPISNTLGFGQKKYMENFKASFPHPHSHYDDGFYISFLDTSGPPLGSKLTPLPPLAKKRVVSTMGFVERLPKLASIAVFSYDTACWNLSLQLFKK